MPDDKVFLGDASLISKNAYDLILANINRNILLQDMKAYGKGLRKDGKLLLSGFYEKDVDAITAAANECGLRFAGMESLHDWTVLLMNK